MKISTFSIGISSLLLALTVATGCAKKEESKAVTKAATQAAAKVNTEEITVHQVNNVLARTPNIAPEALDRAKREILNKLIDQQLAKQAAIDKKLDRSPNVMQSIEGARTEILARAYIESIASAVPKPTPEEVKKYYADHPELFAERRIYNLQEIVIPSADGITSRLEGQVAKARSIEDVAAWLTTQKVKFTASRGVRAAEALPLALLASIQSFKVGEMRLIAVGNSLNVFRVAGIQSAPVDQAAATPRIQQFLFNQRASEAAVAEMKKLRDKTEISLLGEFVETPAAAEARLKAQSEANAKALDKAKSDEALEAKARADAKAKVAADAQASSDALVKAREARLAADAQGNRITEESKGKSGPPKAPQVQQENIEKGLRGLK